MVVLLQALGSKLFDGRGELGIVRHQGEEIPSAQPTQASRRNRRDGGRSRLGGKDRHLAEDVTWAQLRELDRTAADGAFDHEPAELDDVHLVAGVTFEADDLSG